MGAQPCTALPGTSLLSLPSLVAKLGALEQPWWTDTTLARGVWIRRPEG